VLKLTKDEADSKTDKSHKTAQSARHHYHHHQQSCCLLQYCII